MALKHSLVWFRRDLRFTNNTALSNALTQSDKVSCVFIFDEDILKSLPPNDRRVSFIWESIEDMNRQLAKNKAGPIHLFFGKPEQVISRLITNSKINAIYVNHDYEPSAIDRDNKIRSICDDIGVSFHTSKDQVLFEKSEIVKKDGSPYRVFTAYKNTWLAELAKLPPDHFSSAPIAWKKIIRLSNSGGMIKQLTQIGFKPVPNIVIGGETAGKVRWMRFYTNLLDDYAINRDLPGLDKTSYLSPYLRFGNVSIRELVGKLKEVETKGPSIFLSELIWREFFMMILFHFPHAASHSFNAAYDGIPWQNRKDWFNAWCRGITGFPIVDAGMRQLNETGFMHNRVRMITASFLVKHLHIDWRWGENYFAQRLLDFELSSNNGNWQWAAGTGVDAAPYFRIFNPLTQSKRFDPHGNYIRRWIPELKDCNTKTIHEPHKFHQNTSLVKYPMPIIDLTTERKKCLEIYAHRLLRKK